MMRIFVSQRLDGDERTSTRFHIIGHHYVIRFVGQEEGWEEDSTTFQS